MITYEWHVDNCVVAKSEFNCTDVVKSVEYTVIATDDITSLSVSLSGSLALSEVSDPAMFIEFKDLTESKVLGWVTTMVDMIELEGSARLKLDALAQTLTVKQLPWQA